VIEALVIEHLHQSLTHVNLKAALVHALLALKLAALRHAQMHHVLTLPKNLAIHVHVPTLIKQVVIVLLAQVVTVPHVVHVALHKSI
jgi:hypothetical protein